MTRRPHDMGGEEGGPIDTVDHGMKFWEKQANALRSTLSARRLVRLDELRRAAEDLGSRYLELGYFERTTRALRTVLLERGLFTEAELAAKVAEVRKRFSSDYEILSRAMQELLEDKGVLTAEQVRRRMEQFEQDFPYRGSRVIAHAWIDPAFKRRLLEDGKAACAELGLDLEADRLIAVENTPEVHNVIVCTLCSCYPRALLGMPPTWYKSENYRRRVVREPRAVLKEFGTVIPEHVAVRVHDSNADMRYVVVPMRPAGTEGWSEDALAAILTRDTLVGVALPQARRPDE